MEKFKLQPGVVTGRQLVDLFAYCQQAGCAIPAVNVIGSNSITAALQAAAEAKSPIIIQFSNGGALFNAGKSLDNSEQRAAIAGAICGALHIHRLAPLYGVPVVLHTDHAAKKLLPWVSGLIAAGEQHHKDYGTTIFSSHMLDLSEQSLDENLAICGEYLERMSKIDMMLEIELGITGGEEDGVDNSDVDSSRLYTQPEHVLQAYDKLKPLGSFTVAASFGNTHGVYKPGNVVLKPSILRDSQATVKKERGTSSDKPVVMVFHGGSGSEKSKIDEAISYGVVKFNIDTDTQWAFTRPIREYVDEKHAYLMSQIGNPEGEDKPNKKQLDPRVYLHMAEKGMADRIKQAFDDLHCIDKFSF